MSNFLGKLKQPQVIALIVMVVIQVGSRYGYHWSDATVQSGVQTGIDLLTGIAGLWVAHKSDAGSIL